MDTRRHDPPERVSALSQGASSGGRIRRGSGRERPSLTRKLQAFSRLFYFAEKKGWIKARPGWERENPSQPRQFTFSPEMEVATLAYFETTLWDLDIADLFRLGIDTGCRLGELLAVEAKDVNAADRFLTVRGEEGTTKNGEVRVVTLVRRALDILTARAAVVPTGRLFHTLNQVKVSRRMRQARVAMGHDGNQEFTFHATRHTKGTRMAEAEVPLLMMMDELGHKTASMTQRYVKMAPAARRTALLAAMGEAA